MPTKINTLDCILGLSLIAARPAAPTNPSPIPAPAPARPKAKPAPISFDEPASEPAGDDFPCAYAAGLAAIRLAKPTEKRETTKIGIKACPFISILRVRA